MGKPAEERVPNHYQGQFWNHLPGVVSYLCRLATGDASLWWMDDLKLRYATPPRRRALVIACGNGWVERDLYDRGIAERFDAFDSSRTYLDEARSKRGDRPIHYFQADFATFRPKARYDLVVNHGALHHAERLYRVLDTLRGAMEPDGVLINWEYVGPDRHQYPADHVALMRAVSETLPPRFKNPRGLEPHLPTMLVTDRTEAVHSAEIERAFADRFEVIERHPLNGGIAWQILWNNVTEFLSDDTEARSAVSALLAADEALSRAGLVPPLFVYSVGRPRRGTTARASFDRFVREPLRETFATVTGGLYPSELVVKGHRRERARMAAGHLLRLGSLLWRRARTPGPRVQV